MLKYKLLLVCFILPLLIVAQNVTIRGEAKSYEFSEIGVWITNDYISNSQRELTYSMVDSMGNFVLEFNAKEILYITLKINKYIASMYVEPNINYEIKILPPDSTTYQNPNLEHDVKISINLKSRTEINSLTMDYDNQFDYFTYVEFVSLYSRKAYPKIDSFKLAMRKFYSEVHNSYFETYITYTIAALEEKTKLSEKKLYSNYIDGKPIQYSNPEYMNFLNTFYKQKIQNFALSKEGFPLSFQINDRGSLTGVINILKRDAFLKNDTISELVLLKGLFESYYDGSFKQKSIIAILQQIATDSRISEHRLIAISILNSLSKLKPGSNAPYFELPDKNGLTHSIDELRDKKYIYLMFLDASCTSCLEQLKVIPAFKKKYGERITFVTITNFNSNAELKNFCVKNPKYDWLFVYDNSKGQLRTNYEIKAIPSYFLINPEGKFVQIPAESPEGDIDRAFYDIVKPKIKLHNVGSKRDY